MNCQRTLLHYPLQRYLRMERPTVSERLCYPLLPMQMLFAVRPLEPRIGCQLAQHRPQALVRWPLGLRRHLRVRLHSLARLHWLVPGLQLWALRCWRRAPVQVHQQGYPLARREGTESVTPAQLLARVTLQWPQA